MLWSSISGYNLDLGYFKLLHTLPYQVLDVQNANWNHLRVPAIGIALISLNYLRNIRKGFGSTSTS